MLIVNWVKEIMVKVKVVFSPCVPELECLIPGACHESSVVWSLDPPTSFDRSLVLCNLSNLVASQIPHLHLLVTRGHKHLKVKKKCIYGGGAFNLSDMFHL